MNTVLPPQWNQPWRCDFYLCLSLDFLLPSSDSSASILYFLLVANTWPTLTVAKLPTANHKNREGETGMC
jgi:hypothetical protein